MVQVFPSTESLIRLSGAICCDYNDKWLNEKWFMNRLSMENLDQEQINTKPKNEEKQSIERSVEEEFERLLKVA